MHTLQNFAFFLSRAVYPASYPAFSYVPLALLAMATVAVLFRSKPVERWKYWLLAPLPLLWIFIGLWGGFWLFTPSPPAWVILPVPISFCIYLTVAIGLVVYLRGIRWFTALFAVFNFYFMFVMAALTNMVAMGFYF